MTLFLFLRFSLIYFCLDFLHIVLLSLATVTAQRHGKQKQVDWVRPDTPSKWVGKAKNNSQLENLCENVKRLGGSTDHLY